MNSNEQTYTVSELTVLVKDLLESSFPSVWVAGEISDFARPRSGHCYLTLRDESCQLRAVIWKGTAARVRFDLHDGLEVVCRGHIDVYAPRGTYQLIVEAIEPEGIGVMELALRQLRDKLAAEGLFDPARKRPLARFARRIALLTSPTGAAIRDFLEVLRRRWRGADVLVVPVPVQGEGAARQIADAIQTVNRLSGTIDCIVVTRGGGSLEDLWAFNEEPVIRAIAASAIPVVSAVGHEIDVTLADLAADVRAATPSEAAELVVPAAEEVAAALGRLQKRMTAALQLRASAARSRLDALAATRPFRRPREIVHDRARRLDELEARLVRGLRGRLSLAQAAAGAIAARLESLSPLAVLGRGYSLTQRTADGQLVRNAADLATGDQLRTRFAHGQTLSRVERVEA